MKRGFDQRTGFACVPSRHKSRYASKPFGKLSSKLGGAQAYYVPVGSVTRLQVGPYASRADASAACARLKPQACFPVAAN